MSVLQQVLDWSLSRPAWQRDALRRLVRNGPLSDTDIRELGLILQAANGVAVDSARREAVPLDGSHLAIRNTSDPTVVLTTLRDLVNVNALSRVAA
jgi:hypothetical protein